MAVSALVGTTASAAGQTAEGLYEGKSYMDATGEMNLWGAAGAGLGGMFQPLADGLFAGNLMGDAAGLAKAIAAAFGGALSGDGELLGGALSKYFDGSKKPCP